MKLFTATIFIAAIEFSLHNVDSSSLFDSNGRLYQVEYAARSPSLGGPVIAANIGSTIVIISCSSSSDDYTKPFVSKCMKIDKCICVAGAGIAADYSYISSKLFDSISESYYSFGTTIPVSRLAQQAAEIMHEHTLSNSLRPIGLKLLIAGYGANGEGGLFVVDPFGSVSKRKFVHLGEQRHHRHDY